MQYLLIDGNNLAIRAAFANNEMRNSSGSLSGAHYGFFSSLLNLKNKFPNYQILVVWDSGSQRRKDESSDGVAKNIIKETYKANRKKGEQPEQLKAWFETGHHLKNALGMTGIPQIRIEGYEADDVIASYANILKKDNEVMIVTSDKDYYQILDDNVIIWDGMKEDFITKGTFESDYGITPSQYVHVGALMGDSSDNIFGIPGWGEKTSITYIKKHGSWEGVINFLKDKYAKYRQEYPDYSDEGNSEFLKLNPDASSVDREKVFQYDFQSKKTETGRYVYPDIYWGQPFSGILDGFEKKKVKISKKDLMALMFQDRIELAFSLKKMDDDIEGLPEICNLKKNKGKLLEYFEYYDIVSLIEKIDVLF